RAGAELPAGGPAAGRLSGAVGALPGDQPAALRIAAAAGRERLSLYQRLRGPVRLARAALNVGAAGRQPGPFLRPPGPPAGPAAQGGVRGDGADRVGAGPD